jgi:hypothetical protein
MKEEISITQVGAEELESFGYDKHVETAKRHPRRSIPKIIESCNQIVAISQDVAQSCRYVLPRGGKRVSGPSVHLARIIMQQYGNSRSESRIKLETDKHVVAEAVCFDLENNNAIKVEVRRSIIGRYGRYNDDMITMTGNAARAIAYRNAVFDVIPYPITNAVLDFAIKVMVGDLDTQEKLNKALNAAYTHFQKSNVSEDMVRKAIGLKEDKYVKIQDIADLKSMMQAIKDGDSTINEMFSVAHKAPADRKKDIKGNKPPQMP